jgi:DNA-directed RNA polymerase specialized sigma24 family protein
MHNQNVNSVRRRAREGITVEVDDTWPVLAVATDDPTAALALRDLDRALAEITEERHRVILLIGLEGTSYEEAATILDVPIGTVRSRLSRGRESLRTLMDRRDGTEAAIGAGNLGEREIHRKQIAISHAPSREARPLGPRDLARSMHD